jgi:hypothetical protein
MQPYPFPVNNDNMISLREIHPDPFWNVFSRRFSTDLSVLSHEYSQLEQEEFFASYHTFKRRGGIDRVLLQEYPNLERGRHPETCRMYRTIRLFFLYRQFDGTSARGVDRWFCSDLTQESIAMLNEDEHPHVEFCN